MKTLIYLFLIVTLVIAGCSKDEIFDDNVRTPELKKAKVPIPMKQDMCAIPDWDSEKISLEQDPSYEVPSIMLISGNATHLGRVDSKNSFYKIEVFTLFMEDGVMYNFQSGSGILIGANGDSIELIWWAKGVTGSPTYIGEFEITNGTGKFEGCSGTIFMQGTDDPKTKSTCWTAEGYIQFD